MSLKDKKILLTGASGGLGSIITTHLMTAGALVTGLDRQDGELIPNIEADLGSETGIQTAATKVAETDWDILINLAGMQHFGPVEAQSPSHTATSYMVNLIAPVMLTQAVLPAMKARGSGQIVNIGSIFGSIPFAHFASYSSAKAGLKGFSDALRREVRDFGVDVTYVAPRAVKTPFNGPQVTEFARLTNMRMDDPFDVADLIVEAVERRKKTVYLGMPESLFVRLNALLPGIVDGAVAGDTRIARSLFALPTQQA